MLSHTSNLVLHKAQIVDLKGIPSKLRQRRNILRLLQHGTDYDQSWKKGQPPSHSSVFGHCHAAKFKFQVCLAEDEQQYDVRGSSFVCHGTVFHRYIIGKQEFLSHNNSDTTGRLTKEDLVRLPLKRVKKG